MSGLAALAGLGSGGAAYAMARGRNPYYSGPVSDHFDGTRFFNPGGMAPKGFGELLKWQTSGEKAKWPSSATSPFSPARPDARVEGAAIRVTMAGHASLLIQTGGLNILTDPVWSNRASPFSFAGPKRVIEPGIPFENLPPIDVVLVTHNHYDHLDLTTLARLRAAYDPLVITPLGNDTIIRNDQPSMRVVTGDWQETRTHGGLAFHFERCHHWSARGMGDRSKALWAAFVIEGPGGRIFHIGDTGFDEGRPYRSVAERHGPIRLAILPIGAYEPRWFMQNQHQNPDEAVEGFMLTGAAHALGHHWGTFQLTDEARDDPPAKLLEALDARGIARDRFRALQPGEVFDLPSTV